MTEDLVVYGIANCDAVRRVRRELDAAGLEYRFHDFRKDGLDAVLLDRWLGCIDWESLLNRRGTTWRNLPAEVRDAIDATQARALMLKHPSLVRRPVIVHAGGMVLVGGDAARATLLSDKG